MAPHWKLEILMDPVGLDKSQNKHNQKSVKTHVINQIGDELKQNAGIIPQMTTKEKEKSLVKYLDTLSLDDLVRQAVNNPNIKTYFRPNIRKYKNIHITCDRLDTDSNYHTHLNLFRLFGECLNNITVHFDSSDNARNEKLHDALITHCSGTTKVLTLYYLTSTMRLSAPWKKVTHFMLSECKLHSSYLDFAQMFPVLEAITFEHVDFDNERILNRCPLNLPQLDTLAMFTYRDTFFKKRSMDRFIKSNPQLRAISLNQCARVDGMELSHEYMEWLDKCLPKLELMELRFIGGAPHPNRVSDKKLFEHLKLISLTTVFENTLEYLNVETKNIEEITLWQLHGLNKESIDFLRSCPKLRYIDFSIRKQDDIDIMATRFDYPLQLEKITITIEDHSLSNWYLSTSFGFLFAKFIRSCSKLCQIVINVNETQKFRKFVDCDCGECQRKCLCNVCNKSIDVTEVMDQRKNNIILNADNFIRFFRKEIIQHEWKFTLHSSNRRCNFMPTTWEFATVFNLNRGRKRTPKEIEIWSRQMWCRKPREYAKTEKVEQKSTETNKPELNATE